jgi:hypothetical protein
VSRVDFAYEDPTAYDDAESFHGDGRLPPDWDARRDAVEERQSGRCVTCGRELYATEDLVVEHVRPPAEGGDHRLKNLVGRCRACSKRGRHISERHGPDAGSTDGGGDTEAGFSWLVFAGAFLVACSPLLYDSYSNAGPRAPDAFLAYLPWVLEQYVDAAFGLLGGLVEFLGTVLLILLFVLWFAEQ